MKLYSLTTILILIAVAFGCAGSGANPVQPIDKRMNNARPAAVDPGRQLWGVWDIGIDLETLTATAVPDRDAETHFNILPFLSPPFCADCLKLHVNSFDPATRILDLDVTLRSIFKIQGYDVRGIVFTDNLGHLLKNEDAWTGSYDIPGGDTINPFRAYSKDDPLRQFPGLSTKTENYRIWVPPQPRYLAIKYAVDASYPKNCLEPYAIGNFSQDKIMNQAGSHGNVSVTVSDWQDDVDAVSLQASVITGEDSTPLTHQSGNIWSADVTNNQGAASGTYSAKITATSTGSGSTALYYFATITISEPAGPAGWARTWGGTDDDSGYGVAVDGSGNIYEVGSFKGTVDFDPGSGVDNQTSNSGSDIYLSKFDSSGNFMWVRTWGGIADDEGLGVAADKLGNIYVTGAFSGTVDFDPGSGVDNHTATGAYDICLSKLDSSGNYQWARTWGGSGDDSGWGVAVDGSGNAYVTGWFKDTVDFDTGGEVDNHISAGNNDVFVSKFDSSGNYQWAATWGGSGDDAGYSVSADKSGNVYVTGYFNGTADFDPGSGVDNHTSNGSYDTFLSKFDSAGSYGGAATWGGGAYDVSYSVVADGSGDVYVTGLFHGTVDFDPGSGDDSLTSNGSNDVFISNFDSSLHLKWARTWGGSEDDSGWGVAVDGSGNAYVTGYFKGEVDFDPGSGVDNHDSNGNFGTFLSKFDSTGKFKWASALGTSNGESYSRGVALDIPGNEYVTGYFGGEVDFDPGSGVDNHTSNGGYDAFLSKFDPNGNW